MACSFKVSDLPLTKLSILLKWLLQEWWDATALQLHQKEQNVCYCVLVGGRVTVFLGVNYTPRARVKGVRCKRNT